MNQPRTKSFWRNDLPHWEIEEGTYFFTIRCAESLPKEALQGIAEIHRSMNAVEPASEAFRLQQRRYFRTLEKYLDAGTGFCPFRDARCCVLVREALASLTEDGWIVRHFVLMPNHLHALIDTTQDAAPMKAVWRAWKGRTAREANRLLGRTGPFWQRDWFDRWMRDPAAPRVVDYIRNNPVKAGLVQQWEDYPWLG
ncbi:MAG: transposase [Opitutales bacterium]|nr:transposase [Opitutales bacterium]